MADLLNRQEHFVHSPDLVNSEPSWAYLQSHELRGMGLADSDYKYLDLVASSQPSTQMIGGPGSSN